MHRFRCVHFLECQWMVCEVAEVCRSRTHFSPTSTYKALWVWVFKHLYVHYYASRNSLPFCKWQKCFFPTSIEQDCVTGLWHFCSMCQVQMVVWYHIKSVIFWLLVWLKLQPVMIHDTDSRGHKYLYLVFHPLHLTAKVTTLIKVGESSTIAAVCRTP